MGHSNDYCVGMAILLQMEGRQEENQQTGGNSNRAGDEEQHGGQVWLRDDSSE